MVEGKGDDQLWGSGRGAIAGCHSVLWLGEGVVPLQAAMVVCYCSVLWLGGRVTTNFTLGEWTWCHRWVPLQGAIVVCYGGEREGFGGVDMGPLLGAIAGCQFLFHTFFLYSGPPISSRRQRKQQ